MFKGIIMMDDFVLHLPKAPVTNESRKYEKWTVLIQQREGIQEDPGEAYTLNKKTFPVWVHGWLKATAILKSD